MKSYNVYFDTSWTQPRGINNRLKLHTCNSQMGSFVKLLVAHGSVGQTHTFTSMEG